MSLKHPLNSPRNMTQMGEVYLSQDLLCLLVAQHIVLDTVQQSDGPIGLQHVLLEQRGEEKLDWPGQPYMFHHHVALSFCLPKDKRIKYTHVCSRVQHGHVRCPYGGHHFAVCATSAVAVSVFQPDIRGVKQSQAVQTLVLDRPGVLCSRLVCLQDLTEL